MTGILGVLPPGLQGWEAADQERKTNQARQLGMLAQFAQLQGAAADRDMKAQMMPLQLEQLRTAIDETKRKAAQEAALREARGGLLAPQNPIPGALSAGAAQGDVGPTVGNAERLATAPPTGMLSLNPAGVQRYIAAGGNPKDIEGIQNLGPMGQMAKVNPKDFDPESFAAFMQTNNPAVLRPRTKVELAPSGVAYDPFNTKPGTAFADPNKAFSIGPNGLPVPNLPFQKYEIGKAAAGASRQITNVNAFTPASEEAQRDFIKSSRATYDQLKQAPVALQSIEKAKALIPGAKGFMGPGGESLLNAAKFLNNRVGTNINTEGVKDAEELRTRIFFNIMDNLKKMDAQPSQQQQQIMQEALGRLGTDPGALPRVLDAFGDVIKDKVVLHNREVSGAIQRGVKFPYDPIIDLRSSPQSSTPVRRYNPATGRIE